MARILVVEDDILMRRVLLSLLMLSKHEADCLPEGTNAVEMQRQKGYDLVITDLFMKGMDGLKTIRELRSEFPTLKILAITGGGGIGEPDFFLNEALHTGADAVLAKPFEKDQLEEQIRTLLSEDGIS